MMSAPAASNGAMASRSTGCPRWVTADVGGAGEVCAGVTTVLGHERVDHRDTGHPRRQRQGEVSKPMKPRAARDEAGRAAEVGGVHAGRCRPMAEGRRGAPGRN